MEKNNENGSLTILYVLISFGLGMDGPPDGVCRESAAVDGGEAKDAGGEAGHFSSDGRSAPFARIAQAPA